MGGKLPPGVICDSLGVMRNQNHNVVLYYERSLRNIEGMRHDRYLDLGNGSNKFGNHCFNPTWSIFESDNLYAKHLRMNTIANAVKRTQEMRCVEQSFSWPPFRRFCFTSYPRKVRLQRFTLSRDDMAHVQPETVMEVLTSKNKFIRS